MSTEPSPPSTPPEPTPRPAPDPSPVPAVPLVPPEPGRGRRLVEVATLVSALTGVVGLLLGFFGLPAVVNSPTARVNAPVAQPAVTVTVTAPPPAGGTPAESGGQGSTPPPADAKPISKVGIRMPTGYHVVLSDDPIELREGYGGDLGYDSGMNLGFESSGGEFVALDRSQQGSLETCKADTRFADSINKSRLIKGAQVCVYTDSFIGLAIIREAPQERDGKEFVTFDLTVWPKGP